MPLASKIKLAYFNIPSISVIFLYLTVERDHVVVNTTSPSEVPIGRALPAAQAEHGSSIKPPYHRTKFSLCMRCAAFSGILLAWFHIAVASIASSRSQPELTTDFQLYYPTSPSANRITLLWPTALPGVRNESENESISLTQPPARCLNHSHGG